MEARVRISSISIHDATQAQGDHHNGCSWITIGNGNDEVHVFFRGDRFLEQLETAIANIRSERMNAKQEVAANA